MFTSCVRCLTRRSRTRRTDNAACCSVDFIATKRIVERVTASQIASASTAWHEPGVWRAPAALITSGLLEGLGRPTLAQEVEKILQSGNFPLIIGGDCSILLGALAGATPLRALSLVHIDGHSDFRHPGNWDPELTLGAVAGMDLALATGRGDALLTEWPGAPKPLVADRHVIQIGERENREADYAWPDVNDTDIHPYRRLRGECNRRSRRRRPHLQHFEP